MPRVLIPFSDFRSGERAVRRLLARRRDVALEVELLAVVDPLTPGKVRIFLSRERAKALATQAAARWVEVLGAMLDMAGVSHRARIASGSVRRILGAEGARHDVDEVLLGGRRNDPMRGVRRRVVAHAMTRPLFSVS